MVISVNLSMIVYRQNLHDLVYIQNLHYFNKTWNWIVSTNNCIYSGFENSFQTQIGITRDVKTMEHVSDNEYCLFLLHALTRKIKYWKIKDLIWYTSVIIYFYSITNTRYGVFKCFFQFWWMLLYFKRKIKITQFKNKLVHTIFLLFALWLS